MAGNSNVGTRTIYESNEQRNITRSEVENARRNRDNPPDSNRRGSAHEKEQKSRGKHSPTDDELAKIDPTAPARMHGHKPSRGAQVDAELKREDEERIRQKQGL
ncbi:hypothetical protein TMEN_7132 [Trichophyton mentagrophytes]|uniref:Uncharacterized protein n=3 Tax=Trichophyton TaxID=5550 RepID=A0A059J246_TRIIM|nr:hypothetical protein TESG_03166 [Trichophyton tonsurans CBS 112818]EGE07649.1 hypothetical protein TEQG_06633 [Trichophyton equinum CBS 127.97]EZF36020.1 hypothetical protein H101_00465 [Trichophyton interdigitale H6]KAG5208270.1 hypothetical protein GY631_5798 [Trichophyton interdigitale]KDB21708.1 hypothetical protein H109_06357 [Trichophyton interdigitale MR816]GBF64430.1 hypothetical protein TMEN_7132 [Trichophyton mentagrophytes]